MLAISLALLVGALAVTNQSLWIDEGNSAIKATQPSIDRWWTKMVEDRGSDLQMPFYMIYLWMWAKIFGVSEIGLRAANIPWFAIGVVAVISSFPKTTRLQLSVFLLTVTNAFLWYYLSEARPYIVLFAFSAIVTACLLRLVADDDSSNPVWFRFFCVGLVGLCATSLIAVPWAIGAMMAAAGWLGVSRTRRLLRQFRYAAITAAAALMALAIYYFWTLRVGAHASDVGETRIMNIPFIFYEICGLSGLGPGRLIIRDYGIAAFQHFLPSLAFGIAAVATLGLSGMSAILTKISLRRLIWFCLAVVLPSLLVFVAGYMAHMRLLGRHLMPLLPFIICFSALGLNRLFSHNHKWMHVIASATIAILLLSALEIRFSPRHQRDDYRSAAAEAQHAIRDEKRVWWAADVITGTYYNLPLGSPNLTLISSLGDRSVDSVLPPDLVCLSKRDIYDSSGKIDQYLRQHHYKIVRVLPAFQIFGR